MELGELIVRQDLDRNYYEEVMRLYGNGGSK